MDPAEPAAVARLAPFPPSAAPLVSGWARTADEVAAWCSRAEAPVPPEVVIGWSRKRDVRAHLLLAGARPVAYGELWAAPHRLPAPRTRQRPALACYTAAGFTRVPDHQEHEWNHGQPHPYLWMLHTR